MKKEQSRRVLARRGQRGRRGQQVLSLILAVLLLAGVLAGCNGVTGGSLKSDSDGSVLRINLASEPDYLDPALSSAVDSGTLATNSFTGLFTTDAKGNIVPALVESYEESPDELTYTFKLKDGLKWSDGSPLTAKDFEYSWKRAANPKTGATYSYLFDCFAKKGDVIDVSSKGNTLVAHLAAPCAYFLDLCAFPTFFPVPAKYVKRADPTGTNPGKWCSEAGFVSNGAYVLKKWNHNESMIYEKNPYYYQANKVHVRELQFMLTADHNAAYSAYNAGDLDFADGPPGDIITSIKNRADFHTKDQLGTYFMSFNVNSPLFKGMSASKATTVRKALCLLIDRPYIVAAIGQTGQKVANSFVPLGMSDGNGGIYRTNTKDGYFPTTYNAASARKEARALLESVGYKFGSDGKLASSNPITFDYDINADEGHQAIAETLQSDWAALGITCHIKTEEWNTFIADRKDGKFTASRGGWIADFNDPITMLDLFESKSENNDAQLGKEPGNSAAPAWGEYDSLIHQIKTTTDMAERVNLMHQAEDMLMSTYAVIPIYYYNSSYLCKTNVKGIYSTLFGMKFFMYAHVDK